MTDARLRELAEKCERATVSENDLQAIARVLRACVEEKPDRRECSAIVIDFDAGVETLRAALVRAAGEET